MKSKRREVEYHFKRLTRITAQLKEGIKEAKKIKSKSSTRNRKERVRKKWVMKNNIKCILTR